MELLLLIHLYIKYNITELNTAVKPFFFSYLFGSYQKADEIIYLDPDVVLFSTFNDLEKEFKTNDIIITPHITKPLRDDKLLREEDFLNSGLYNLGFIGIRRSQGGQDMLSWWSERLLEKGFIDFKSGLFTDQKWIDFVPLFFKNVRIFTNPGYNIAYWNLHERKLSLKDDKYFVNDIYPLVFYHFSGYDPRHPDILSKYQDRFSFKDLPMISNLFKTYSVQLSENGFKDYIQYSNDYTIIKERTEKEKRKELIQKMPLLIRLFRILVLKIAARYNLLLE